MRYDKSHADAATHYDVAQLYAELKRTGRTLSNAGRGANGAAAAEAKPPGAKRQKVSAMVLGGKLPAAYTGLNTFEIVADLFQGQEVAFLTSHSPEEVSHLQMLAATLGARLSVNVSAATRYAVVDDELAAGEDEARKQVRAKHMTLNERAVELAAAARAYRLAAASAAERERRGAAAGAGARADAGAGSARAQKRGRGGGAAASRKAEEKAAPAAVDFASLDIVTCAWLERCEAARRLLPLEPSDALHMSAASAEVRDGIMDEWGDRFFEPTSPEELRVAMRLVRQQRQPSAGGACASNGVATRGVTDGVADVYAVLRGCDLPDEEVLRLDPPPHGALRHPRRCVTLVPTEYASGAQDSLHPLRGCLATRVVELAMLGARVVHEVTDEVTTVLLPADARTAEADTRRLRERFNALRAEGGLVHNVAYVRSSWVDACQREAGWADEAAHRVAVPAAA